MAPKRSIPPSTEAVTKKMKVKTTAPCNPAKKHDGSIHRKIDTKGDQDVDYSDKNKDEANTESKECDSPTVTSSDKTITGLDLFRKEYYAKHIKKNANKSFAENQKAVVIAWKGLRNEERNRYNEKANAMRAAYRKKKGLSTTHTTAFQTRCSPTRFHQTIATLKKPQRDAIKEMGYGSLLQLDCVALNRVLCLELVKSFDLHHHSLCIKGCRILVNYDDVGLVMGIPTSGMQVKTNATLDELHAVQDLSGLKVNDLENILEKEMSGVRFKRAWLLYTLATLLCPTSNNAPSSKLLATIIDIDRVREYNWSKFVFDWLVKEITLFKQASVKSSKVAEKKSIGGCMYFLMVIYFHKRPLGSIHLSNDVPLLKRWTTISVQNRIKEEKNHEQGLLYDLQDSVHPTWLHSTFKHEVTRFAFKQMIELVLKPLDDALMAGQFNLSPVQNPTPSSFQKAEVHDERSVPAGETEKDAGLMQDEDDAEATITLSADEDEMKDAQSLQVRPTRQLKKAPLKRSPFVSGRQTKKASTRSSMLQTLYCYCTRKPTKNTNAKETLIHLFDQIITREDAYSLKPRGWVDTMIILFAAKIFMEAQRERNHIVNRVIFNHWFIEQVKGKLDEYKQGAHKLLSNKDVKTFISPKKLGYDIRQANVIIAPALFENHWYCYVLDRKQNKIFVLDSMARYEGSEKPVLDKATKTCFEDLMAILDPTLRKQSDFLDIVYVDLPKQQNSDDCGIYVLKYMEMWDGVQTWEGKTMPKYSLEDICKIRQDLLCGWVLHPKNDLREQVLKDAGVPGLLTLT